MGYGRIALRGAGISAGVALSSAGVLKMWHPWELCQFLWACGVVAQPADAGGLVWGVGASEAVVGAMWSVAPRLMPVWRWSYVCCLVVASAAAVSRAPGVDCGCLPGLQGVGGWLHMVILSFFLIVCVAEVLAWWTRNRRYCLASSPAAERALEGD